MASNTSGSFTTQLAAGSNAANKYTMTLGYNYQTLTDSLKTRLTITGTIKSNNSAYSSYRNSSKNTVYVCYNNSDGYCVLSKTPTTAYDCRNQGSTQIFSYSIDVPHDESGNRTVWIYWFFDGLQSQWNPTGTVTGTITFSQLGYTISYNANGGSGAPSSQSKVHGESITLSSTIPTRSGYVFQNWNTLLNGSGTSYTPGTTYTANVSVTLYAQWAKDGFTVIYNANGGIATPKSKFYTSGSTVYITSNKPIRSGYTFKGWGISPSTTSVTYSPNEKTNITSAITLYAVWSKNSSQDIYLYSTGECYASEFVEDDNVKLENSGKLYALSFEENITYKFYINSAFGAIEFIEGYPKSINIAGGVIQFYLNGKQYMVETDADGVTWYEWANSNGWNCYSVDDYVWDENYNERVYYNGKPVEGKDIIVLNGVYTTDT